MSSEEEPDLPVAVRCMREQNGYPDLESTAIGRSILKPGNELVKKSDAEEDIQEARKTKEMHFTQVILEAEQRGIVSADQAQEINDLREELEEEVDE